MVSFSGVDVVMNAGRNEKMDDASSPCLASLLLPSALFSDSSVLSSLPSPFGFDDVSNPFRILSHASLVFVSQESSSC